jgi:hypothetical protein
VASVGKVQLGAEVTCGAVDFVAFLRHLMRAVLGLGMTMRRFLGCWSCTATAAVLGRTRLGCRGLARSGPFVLWLFLAWRRCIAGLLGRGFGARALLGRRLDRGWQLASSSWRRRSWFLGALSWTHA